MVANLVVSMIGKWADLVVALLVVDLADDLLV